MPGAFAIQTSHSLKLSRGIRAAGISTSTMSLDIETRLEAQQTINELRAIGGVVLIVYKPNMIDRYLQIIPKGLPVPGRLRNKFHEQSESIARILIEEAAEVAE